MIDFWVGSFIRFDFIQDGMNISSKARLTGDDELFELINAFEKQFPFQHKGQKAHNHYNAGRERTNGFDVFHKTIGHIENVQQLRNNGET